MPRKTGRRASLYMPTSAGIAYTNTALTINASKTIGGTAYANRFYGTSTRSAWNRAATMSARLQGLVGEVTITPGTAVDTINVSAFSYHKDNSGAQTGTAATGVSVTRHATGAQWNMVTVNVATGTVAVTAGLVSASTTAYNDTWAAVGGPAYVAATNLIIGAVRLTPGTATTTLASEIFYKMVDGTTLLQERSDVPSFTILPMEGGVLLNSAVLACHTAGTRRIVYASYTDQFPMLAKIGDVEGWTLSGSGDVVDLEAAEDISPQKDLGGAISTSGTFTRFYVQDSLVWNLAMQRRTAGVVRLYPDENDTSIYYEGAIIVTDWGTDVSIGDGVKDSVSFGVDGILELRGV